MRNNIVKLPPKWKQYRKMNDKTQQALQEAIKQAMKESSERDVHIYLSTYINNQKL